MEHENNNFIILKKHEDSIESSVLGKMTQVLQLCQNNTTKSYYYTYEVLDLNGSIVGNRLIYEFKKPNQALDEWEDFIGEGLKSSDEFTVSKQSNFSNKQ